MRTTNTVLCALICLVLAACDFGPSCEELGGKQVFQYNQLILIPTYIGSQMYMQQIWIPVYSCEKAKS